MADVLWYYAKHDEQLGPVTPTELKSLATKGTLLPSDLIWREGMDGWAPAAKVKGLFPEAAIVQPATIVSNGPTETMPPTAVAELLSSVATVTSTPGGESESVAADVFMASRNTPVPTDAMASGTSVRATPPAVANPAEEKPNYLAASQLLLWLICVAIILIGGVLFLGSVATADDAAERSATGATYAAFFLAAFILARAGDRIAVLLVEYFKDRPM